MATPEIITTVRRNAKGRILVTLRVDADYLHLAPVPAPVPVPAVTEVGGAA